MKGIRLNTQARVYDLFQRIAVHAQAKRGVLTLKPYTGARSLKQVEVDEIPYPGFGKALPTGVTHKLNGSLVTLEYKACHKPTKEQIAKAEYATQVLGIPRRRFTGTLVDVFFHKGALYALLAGVLERDREGNKHHCNFRMMNIDDGDLDAAFVAEPRVTVVAKNPLGKGTTKKGVRV